VATVRKTQANSKFSSNNPTNFEEVTAKLEAASHDTVATLRASLFDGSSSARVRAAVAILSLGAIATEAWNLDRRVAELERLKWKTTSSTEF